MQVNNMSDKNYTKLAEVLLAAYKQASEGKGKERHANDLPFEKQPMQTINREQGSIDGFLFQARKKAIEARGLPKGRAQAELLGAINYLAGAVIALDSWAADTLPKEQKPEPEEKEPTKCLAIESAVGKTYIYYLFRNGKTGYVENTLFNLNTNKKYANVIFFRPVETNLEWLNKPPKDLPNNTKLVSNGSVINQKFAIVDC